MRDATRLSMFVATEEAFFLWYGTVQCVWVNDSPKLMEAVTATVPAEKFCKLLPIWVSAKCAGIGFCQGVWYVLNPHISIVVTVAVVDCSELAWFYLVFIIYNLFRDINVL